MIDVERLLRDHAKNLDRNAVPIGLDELADRFADDQVEAPPLLLGPRRIRESRPRRPRWAAALIAAAVVLLLIGGVGLLVRVLRGDGQPVIEEETPPTTAVEGVEAGWSVVRVEEGLLDGAFIRSMIRGGPGWVAVGAQDAGVADSAVTDTTAPSVGGGLRPGVWLSEDGVQWTRVPPGAFSGEGVGGMSDVAEGGPGLVAVGQVGCAATVWISSDGQSWSQLPYDESVFAGSPSTSEGTACSAINTIVAGPSALVALGEGRGPGDSNRESPLLWTSHDGLTWRRLTQAEAGLGDRYVQIKQMVQSGPGFVAVGTACAETPGEVLRLLDSEGEGPTCQAAIWTSSDGTSWHRVPHDEQVFGGTGGTSDSSSSARPGWSRWAQTEPDGPSGLRWTASRGNGCRSLTMCSRALLRSSSSGTVRALLPLVIRT